MSPADHLPLIIDAVTLDVNRPEIRGQRRAATVTRMPGPPSSSRRPRRSYRPYDLGADHFTVVVAVLGKPRLLAGSQFICRADDDSAARVPNRPLQRKAAVSRQPGYLPRVVDRQASRC
jgi:hypothetical protein